MAKSRLEISSIERLFYFTVSARNVKTNSFAEKKGDVYLKEQLSKGSYWCQYYIDCKLSLEKICDAAMLLIPDDVKQICIMEESKLLQLSDKSISFPKNITSIKYIPNKNLTGQTSMDFLSKLPETVSHLEIDGYLDFQKFFITIPKHITSLTIPNIFSRYNDDELAKIFAAIPPHITKINAAHWEPEEDAVEDKQLRKVLLNLPFSVTELIVSINGSTAWRWGLNERPIDMNKFRKDYFFPNSYKEISEKPKRTNQESNNDLFEKAQRILKDYTKIDSLCPSATLFFTLHWNRHHIKEVNQCLQKSKDFNELSTNIKKIQQSAHFNPTGSLARRIRYIEFLMESANNMNQENNTPNF